MSESLPKISLHNSAHYVTQQSIWDNQLLGPLTDHRIKHYEKLGKYGEERKRLANLSQEEKQQKQEKKKLLREKKLLRKECFEGLF
jgi:hypothetical protein